MKVIVREVKSNKELKAFVHFPNELYKDCPYYVPQIESMDRDTLDPKKNHAFDVCEGRYWLAYDEDGKVVGRIAGIINHAYNEKVGEKICRFGWLDFIEDRDVLGALLSAVEDYARENGLDKMNGPVGFLEFDASGVLTDGFDKLPTAYGKYNHPYYDPMIKEFGYGKDTDWVEFFVDLSEHNPERNARAAKIVCERFGLRQAKVTTHKDVAKYVDGIFELMNRCYSRLHGYSELTPGQLDDLKNQFMPNTNPYLLSVVLDKEDKVVGFMFWMPSLSKALIKAKGHLFPFGWFHILRALHKNDTADAMLVAVDPQYEGKGLTALFFDKMWLGMQKTGIKYLEATRELEDNNHVLNISSHYNRTLTKRARCYVKSI
ncbi:MAG: hypothetical protein Q4F39_01115 [Bacteroidia bacterium]|nr:hypothetical protein [Bacteroidia bacterium]